MAELFEGIEGMRRQDAIVFHDVAMAEKLWILVRATNPYSLPYVGDLNCYPKPIDCKAKTAQNNQPRKDGNGSCELRGLVVSPIIHPGAFEDLAKATSFWTQLTAHCTDDLRSGKGRYKLDMNEKSVHHGCLMVKEGGLYRYLHGDYDLKDIVEVGYENWNL